MDITDQIARLYNTTPFDVMERKAEDVIRLINYVLEKYSDASNGDNVGAMPAKKPKDSFWDF